MKKLTITIFTIAILFQGCVPTLPNGTPFKTIKDEFSCEGDVHQKPSKRDNTLIETQPPTYCYIQWD